MAAIIGDVFTDSSRFHNIPGTGLHHQHAHAPQVQSRDPHYRSRSTSRARGQDAPASHPQTNRTADSTRLARTEWESAQKSAVANTQAPSTSGGASRLPSPPSSASSAASSTVARPQDGADTAYMASSVAETSGPTRLVSSAASSSAASSTSTATAVISAENGSHQIPSPASDSGPRWNSSLPDLAAQSNMLSSRLAGSPTPNQTTVHIRDLAHIQSLARTDLLANTGSSSLNDPPLQAMKYEISGMPINDIIEMVAALLTKITTTNDLQHDALNRNAAHIRQAQAAASRSEEGGSPDGSDHMSPLSSSVLAFHGKNVPAITILSYLSRIHKYCPTTYEVFLSLLVYFDRMTERVNDMVLKAEEARKQQLAEQPPQAASADTDILMRDGSDESDETDSDLADDDDEEADENQAGSTVRERGRRAATGTSIPPPNTVALPIPQAIYFVVDSFNIHRLVIAGVTCASKFFSDVFYTNSRYAKVGGLPLAELNHLELQFLLLNDFRLAVPVEDLEAYATMLVEFYAREVVAQPSRPVVGGE